MIKLIAMAAAAVVLGLGPAVAEPMTSGRPSAVLDNAQCQDVWVAAKKEGEVLPKDQARPFIVNFQQSDRNNDGKISADEFKFACGKGMVDPHPTH
ncbi:MAG: hypothetical protein MUO41_12840 [Methyloceanibacter sp.]|jgi:hypothetical protein|nr:hypothetical protein [Methyloceanibacter sp.]